jgi:hypothetical protein
MVQQDRYPTPWPGPPIGQLILPATHSQCDETLRVEFRELRIGLLTRTLSRTGIAI